MAKSTYISSNLNESQIEFLQLLDEHEILYFSLDDIGNRLGVFHANLNELVENLNHKGLLKRIERGKYARPQFHDPYVLGTFISKDGVVAYWSALHLYGYTDRFPNKVFVKTTARKRNIQLFGTPIHFVTVRPYKLSGIVTNGYGDKSFGITNPEVTILDCFDQPRYLRQIWMFITL
jgi:predicted transcriptional regulator of viral defense system